MLHVDIFVTRECSEKEASGVSYSSNGTKKKSRWTDFVVSIPIEGHNHHHQQQRVMTSTEPCFFQEIFLEYPGIYF